MPESASGGGGVLSPGGCLVLGGLVPGGLLGGVCSHGGGGCLIPGVSIRGVSDPGGCLLLGGCLLQGGVCSVGGGGVVSQHALRQTPPL